MPLNKVLSIGDYATYDGCCRKEWEVRMAMATFDKHKLLDGDADFLGVGAGHEATIYELSSRCHEVHATDLYITPGDWKDQAPSRFMVTPDVYAPKGVTVDPRRMVIQHMDMCNLRYPDERFDGVFSSGSIEHVGRWEDVARAAREIGRVLKPGGVASISTEFRISGEGDGWAGVLLFTPEKLIDYIIEPSGLKPVDNKAWTFEVDEATLATAYPLKKIVDTGKMPELEGVLTHGDYVFTSVHLALRKGR